MTVHTVYHSEIGMAIPRLLRDDTVVVVTPGRDAKWAAEEARNVVRAMAGRNRTVALIDLHVGNAGRHAVFGKGEPQAGLTDVLLNGKSLQSVVRRMDALPLFFVGAGKQPADPVAIWTHQRLGRLRENFAREHALLLLYAPADALAHLRVRPDRVVMLSAETHHLSASDWAKRHRVPVTYLLPDPPAAQLHDPSVEVWSSHIAKNWRPRRHRLRPVTVALVTVVLLAFAILLMRFL